MKCKTPVSAVDARFLTSTKVLAGSFQGHGLWQVLRQVDPEGRECRGAHL